MAREKIKGKDILDQGYPEGKIIGLALNLMEKYYKSTPKDEQLALLNDLFHNPEKYRNHKKLQKLVQELDAEKTKLREIALTESQLDFKTYGAEYIEPGAVFQMETAMSLPITFYAIGTASVSAIPKIRAFSLSCISGSIDRNQK